MHFAMKDSSETKKAIRKITTISFTTVKNDQKKTRFLAYCIILSCKMNQQKLYFNRYIFDHSFHSKKSGITTLTVSVFDKSIEYVTIVVVSLTS